MQIIHNNNLNKISTREDLIDLLNKYNGILTDPTISYLKSLIDLDFSVINNYIYESGRSALSELEIYKKATIYNIYNRALNLFKQNDSELTISGNDEGIEGLKVYSKIGDRNLILFDYDYKDSIGNLSLFKTIESKEQRDEELRRVMCELDKLYDEKNPYHSIPNTYGGPASQWVFEHAKKIQEYEERFNQLVSKKELTDEDKKEIEITKKYHELLLEDYGLTNKDFEKEPNFHILDFDRDRTKMHKTLVKKMPCTNIKNNIKFI
ncbi:MAG: hypothetical protein IJH20_02190 [Bacilli bacterium]|nr:hypothetical protein [Bacilli bacterium]